MEKLHKGHVAFNTPEKMQIGKTKTVQVALGVDESLPDLKSQITAEGKIEAAELGVAAKMTAMLTGGGAFDISPSGPQAQFVTEKGVTPWAFDITPKQTGSQELTLTMDAIFIVNGNEGVRRVNTLTRKILVEVGWPETPAEWFEASKKWFENVSWLWLSVLVPICGFLYSRWRGAPPASPPSLYSSDVQPLPASEGAARSVRRRRRAHGDLARPPRALSG
jgi:hypothetical protein